MTPPTHTPAKAGDGRRRRRTLIVGLLATIGLPLTIGAFVSALAPAPPGDDASGTAAAAPSPIPMADLDRVHAALHAGAVAHLVQLLPLPQARVADLDRAPGLLDQPHRARPAGDRQPVVEERARRGGRPRGGHAPAARDSRALRAVLSPARKREKFAGKVTSA